MSTCQHRSTTFSRDICPDPCGVMHTLCLGCWATLDECAHVLVDPADWTEEQAQAAQAELDELERTDPDVAAAAASYDRMVERVASKTWFGNGRQTDEQRIAIAAERAAADELTRELDTVYAQPTDVDFEKAAGFVRMACAAQGSSEHYAVRTYIATALAVERAAIHARYEALAVRLEQNNDYSDNWGAGWVDGRLAAAVDIRQVAAQ